MKWLIRTYVDGCQVNDVVLTPGEWHTIEIDQRAIPTNGWWPRRLLWPTKKEGA